MSYLFRQPQLTVTTALLDFDGTDVDLDPTGTFRVTMDSGQEVRFQVSDDMNSAFVVESTDGGNYIDVDTTDAGATILFGNATTNPTTDFLGTGVVTFNGNVDADAGLDVTGAYTQSGGNFTFTGGEFDIDPTGDFRVSLDATKDVRFQIADGMSSAFVIENSVGGQNFVTIDTDTAKVQVAGAEFEFVGTNLDFDPTGTFNVAMDAGQEVRFQVADDMNSAFVIESTDGGNYIDIDTTDAGATILFGNATTNPTTDFLGTGVITFNGNVDADAGLDVSGADLTTASGLNITMAGTGLLTTGTAGITAVSGSKLTLGSTTVAPEVASMTTAQRDALSAEDGMLIYNTTTAQFEGYDTTWSALGSGGSVTGTNNISFEINQDASTTDEDPFLQLSGGDGTTEKHGFLKWHAGNEEFELYSDDNGTRVATVLNLGQSGETAVASLDATLDFNSTTDASGAKSARIVYQGQEDDLVLGSGASTVSAAVNLDAEAGLDVTGDLTLATGVATLTANGASSLTTSAGALTLTSAAAATWSTTAGALTVDGADGISLAGNAGEIDLTTTGDIDLNATGAVTIDGLGAVNLTSSASTATLSGGGVFIAGGSSEIDITTTGDLDINAGAVTIDPTGAFTVAMDVSQLVSFTSIASAGGTGVGITTTLAGEDDFTNLYLDQNRTGGLAAGTRTSLAYTYLQGHASDDATADLIGMIVEASDATGPAQRRGIQFTGAFDETLVFTAARTDLLADNLATAYDLKDTGTTYMRVETTTGDKLVEFPGNVDFLGSVNFADDVSAEWGGDQDWTLTYDETTDNALELVGATSAVTVQGTAYSIAGSAGGAASGGTIAGLGGGLLWTSGAGGASATGLGNAAGAGGVFSLTGGAGGAGFASEHNGGVGSPITITGGTGGVGATGQTSGAGGALSMAAGAAGAASGGTQGVGGELALNAGAGVTSGAINIGKTSAQSISLGNATDNTTIDQAGTGQVTFTGNVDMPSLDVSGSSTFEGALRLGEILDPTAVADKGSLYVKDDGGDTELFYRDDSGNIIQLTQDGSIAVSSISFTLQEAYTDGETIAMTATDGDLIISGEASGSWAWNDQDAGLVASAVDISMAGALTYTAGAAGHKLDIAAATLTDGSTAASGTASVAHVFALQAPTLAATNATVTTTDAATMYIAAAPAAGTNMTLTNAYALWVDAGLARFDGNVDAAAGLDVTGSPFTVTNVASTITRPVADTFAALDVAMSSNQLASAEEGYGAHITIAGHASDDADSALAGLYVTSDAVGSAQKIGIWIEDTNLATGVLLGDDITLEFGDDGDVAMRWNSGTSEFQWYADGQPDIEYRMQTTTPIANESGHYFETDLGDAAGSGVLNISMGTGSAALTGTNLAACLSLAVTEDASDAAGTARGGIIFTPVQGSAGAAILAGIAMQAGTVGTSYDAVLLAGDDIPIVFGDTGADAALQWVDGSSELDLTVTGALDINATAAVTIDGSSVTIGSTTDIQASLTTDGRFVNIASFSTGTHAIAIGEDMVQFTGAGSGTVTLPAAASSSGRRLHVKVTGAGDVTIDGNASETIDGAVTYNMSVQYESVMLICDGSQWLIF